MMVYSYTEAREHFGSLLERAVTEGQVKFRGSDGRVFILQPEQPTRTSPLDVPSVSFSLTKREILEAIHESRERTPYALQTGQNPQTE
jgi:hypothetical protein